MKFAPVLLRFLGLVFCGTAVLTALAAQEPDRRPTESAFIYYAAGQDFTLGSPSRRAIFSAESVRGEGIPLERGGIVNTGAGTFLEIQLVPSGAVIKLAGNTSFVYNGIDENGRFADLRLLYGRMRVVTGRTSAAERDFLNEIHSIVIRAGEISARITEGDMGADYILVPGEADSGLHPLFSLYSFRGSAEVFTYGQERTGSNSSPIRRLTAQKGESLVLDISAALIFAERMPVSGEIVNYWSFHNFAGSPPIPMPDTAIAGISNNPASSER